MASDRLLNCARCQQQLRVCRRCDHGQRYCPDPCARQARRACVRAAGQRYQQTLRGRLHHARRQSHWPICSLLEIPLETYIRARNALITKDLIAFDGTRFQVLSLPDTPRFDTPAPVTPETSEDDDPATIHALVRRSLDGHPPKHR